MSTYESAVTEARRLVKRSESDQWRLAELSYEQVQSGVSRSQWGRDVGLTNSYISRIVRIWETYGELVPSTRPTFSEAYKEIVPSAAYQPPAATTPEAKAELARELLADPVVAEQALNTPEARQPGSLASKAVGNVARATEHRRQEDARRTERRDTEDPIVRKLDQMGAGLDLESVCDKFARDGAEALTRVGPLKEGKGFFLRQAADRAGITLAAIRDYLDTGKTGLDAELQKILEGGA